MTTCPVTTATSGNSPINLQVGLWTRAGTGIVGQNLATAADFGGR